MFYQVTPPPLPLAQTASAKKDFSKRTQHLNEIRRRRKQRRIKVLQRRKEGRNDLESEGLKESTPYSVNQPEKDFFPIHVPENNSAAFFFKRQFKNIFGEKEQEEM